MALNATMAIQMVLEVGLAELKHFQTISSPPTSILNRESEEQTTRRAMWPISNLKTMLEAGMALNTTMAIRMVLKAVLAELKHIQTISSPPTSILNRESEEQTTRRARWPNSNLKTMLEAGMAPNTTMAIRMVLKAVLAVMKHIQTISTALTFILNRESEEPTTRRARWPISNLKTMLEAGMAPNTTMAIRMVLKAVLAVMEHIQTISTPLTFILNRESEEPTTRRARWPNSNLKTMLEAGMAPNTTMAIRMVLKAVLADLKHIQTISTALTFILNRESEEPTTRRARWPISNLKTMVEAGMAPNTTMAIRMVLKAVLAVLKHIQTISTALTFILNRESEEPTTGRARWPISNLKTMVEAGMAPNTTMAIRMALEGGLAVMEHIQTIITALTFILNRESEEPTTRRARWPNSNLKTMLEAGMAPNTTMAIRMVLKAVLAVMKHIQTISTALTLILNRETEEPTTRRARWPNSNLKTMVEAGMAPNTTMAIRMVLKVVLAVMERIQTISTPPTFILNRETEEPTTRRARWPNSNLKTMLEAGMAPNTTMAIRMVLKAGLADLKHIQTISTPLTFILNRESEEPTTGRARWPISNL